MYVFEQLFSHKDLSHETNRRRRPIARSAHVIDHVYKDTLLELWSTVRMLKLLSQLQVVFVTQFWIRKVALCGICKICQHINTNYQGLGS